MRVYRRNNGVTVELRKATESELHSATSEFPDDRLLPTLSSLSSFVFCVNGVRMGFVEYFTRESELVVTGLWVRPDERRNGYGTMILELVEVYENPMIMRVIAEPRSEKFYQKIGYEPDFGMRILAKVCND